MHTISYFQDSPLNESTQSSFLEALIPSHMPFWFIMYVCAYLSCQLLSSPRKGVLFYEINNKTGIYEHLLWDVWFQKCYFLHLSHQPHKVWLSQTLGKGNQVAERIGDLWSSYRVELSKGQPSVHLLHCRRSFFSSTPPPTRARPIHTVDFVRGALVCLFIFHQRNFLSEIISEVSRRKIFQTMNSAVWCLLVICSVYSYNPFFQQLFHWGWQWWAKWTWALPTV